MRKDANIFVLGLDAFNHAAMRPCYHNEYHVFGLLDPKEVLEGPQFDVPKLLDKAKNSLRNFRGTIDGIASYWDFPSILMLPILRDDFNLPGPSLESVLKCEHKYWSRLEQKKVIPEHVPGFSLIDPFQDKKLADIPIKVPFWIKPIKAHSSMLGFYIETEQQLTRAMKEIRKKINQFERPFNELLTYATLPKTIQDVKGHHCIVEEIITAPCQCTVEGYVFGKEVVLYGMIDSIRKPNRSSFEAYEYPSRLPDKVQKKMMSIAKKAIVQTGLDHSPFNIEFFYNPDTKHISLLEINARISKSHSLLFEKIDGMAHFKVMLDLAFGKKPMFPNRKGAYQCAAKFMPRLYGHPQTTVITHVPDQKHLKQTEKKFPGTEIYLKVKEGMQLSNLIQQDSYSYQLATIFMGSRNHDILMKQYENCLKALDIKWRRANEQTIKDTKKISP